MTPWQIGGLWLSLGAYTVAWLRGGSPERLAAGVLLLNFLLSSLTYQWQVGGFHLAATIEDCVCLLILGWLCFRSDRWWPIVATAALALTVLTHIVKLLDPAFSQYAAASARIGLGYLIDLALLLGVWERQLAGAPPAGQAAWARAEWITATRRNRRDEARRPEAGPVHAAKVVPE
ncbi:hypothetical protein [Brevundimonas sp.]|uniref:hypothetical protein n=1 Tax=Brevundimonas sp. TaxID=1871086 RepID=UPI002D531228|nr:hypothetical protein [Brevundimonas sp.]HYC98636.1 hypothetical protein [Brevundimonas sp.]